MKAIQELKPQSVNFGLPKEWKILKPSDKNNQDNIDQGPPVDPSNPEILLNKLPENDNWLIIFNPFYTQEFEVHGLAGIENPLDRLVMLRTLVHWALANSEAVKKRLLPVFSCKIFLEIRIHTMLQEPFSMGLKMLMIQK